MGFNNLSTEFSRVDRGLAAGRVARAATSGNPAAAGSRSPEITATAGSLSCSAACWNCAAAAPAQHHSGERELGAEFQLFDATSMRASVVSNSGRVKFFDTAKGGTAAITNYPTTFQAFGIGSTVFRRQLERGERDPHQSRRDELLPMKAPRPVSRTMPSAGNATIYNQPSPVRHARAVPLGSTSFAGAATAANAHIFNNAATTASGGGGLTEFYPGSTQAHATITSQGAIGRRCGDEWRRRICRGYGGHRDFPEWRCAVNGGKGGVVYFYLGDGGSATFRNFPGTVSGAWRQARCAGIFHGRHFPESRQRDSSKISARRSLAPRRDDTFRAQRVRRREHHFERPQRLADRRRRQYRPLPTRPLAGSASFTNEGR